MIRGPHAPYSTSSLVIWKLFSTPDKLPALHPAPPQHLNLHFPGKLSDLSGDADLGQGLEAEVMQTFLETMDWSDPSLVFPSLVPSSGEGLDLGKEWAISGTAEISASKGRRNSEPSNQEVGNLHRTQEGSKKH